MEEEIQQPASTLSTHELRLQAEDKAQQEVDQKYEGVSLWDMSKRLDAAYHIFNDFNAEFAPDPEFDLTQHAQTIKGLNPMAKEAIINQLPQSQQEFDHIVKTANEVESAMSEYANMGITGFGAHALSLMRDPAALALSVATGGLGLAGRAVQGGRVLKVAADAAASEAIIASARLANNPVYSAEDAVMDVALSPLTAFLPTYLGGALSPSAMRVRKVTNESNEAIRDYINSQVKPTHVAEEVTPEAVPDSVPDAPNKYETAMAKYRLDRFGTFARSQYQSVRETVKKAFDDPVGMWKDKEGQGATAEGVAAMHRDFIIPRYHKNFQSAWTELQKEKGLAGLNGMFSHKKKLKELSDSTRRIILAKESKDYSALSPAEVKLAGAIDDALEQAHKAASEAGVTFAQRFQHSNDYWPIYYNRGRIMQHGKSDVVNLFAQSFIKGAEKHNLPLTDAEAKMFAKAMYNKVTNANTMDAVSDLLDDPELLFKTLKAEAMEEGISPDLIRDMIGKFKGTTEKHFKKRAALDRTVSIQTADGKSLSMVDLMDADPIGVVHRYVNRMSGHAGMSKGLGIADDEAWQKLRNSATKEGGSEAVGELDEIRSVIFGYPTHDVSRGISQKVTTLNNMMTGVGLGNAGVASLPDIAIQTFRVGLAATAKAMPWTPKQMKSKDFDALMDMAALHQIGIHSPYLSSMYSQMAEEAVDGVEESIVSAGARKMANVTMRASLLSGITEWTQKTAFYGGVVDAFRQASKGKDIPFAKAETGWTNAEHNRMRELLAGSNVMQVTDSDVERTLSIPDLMKWDATDRETLLRGMYRYSLRAASRSTRGESIAFFEHPLARVVMQFRGIVFGSITKRALSGLTRIGTGLGAKVTAASFMAQAGALYLMSYLKSESKMAGMDDKSRNDYVKRLGFKNSRDYDAFFSGDVDAIVGADGKVLRSLMGYSPSMGGIFEIADITASMLGTQIMGGTRYKPVEETIFSAPAASYAENIGRLMFNGWDGQVSREEANRFKSLMWMNSHPIVTFTSNSIIEAADLKDK